MNNSRLSGSEEMEILDFAFRLVKDTISSSGDAAAKEKLQQMYQAISFEDITALYSRASALVNACHDAGDQCRDKRMTEAQAISHLRERFPGFSSLTYGQALNWGYFLSR